MIHELSVVPMLRGLAALSAILAKAEAHCEARKIAPAALLGFRLFPDMFDLTRQVQLTCDFAARAVSRLSGAEPRAFPDTETTFAELQARIEAVRAHLQGFAPADFEGAATRAITIKLRGADMTFSGLQYLSLFALPQFYFHATTSYDILRHNGVEIGKRDFMGA